MLSIVNSSNLIGINSFIIKVEVDITNGIPCFNIVGLPSTSIRESRERVKSAIINSGYTFPNSRIVVNLSPADMKKDGSFIDLSIAIAILRNMINVKQEYLDESIFIGELSLDGKIAKIKGVLPIIIGAKSEGKKRIFIPYDNIKEGSYIEGIEIIPAKTLKECIQVMNKEVAINNAKDKFVYNDNLVNNYTEDFEEVKGNHLIKRGAEIAAAGNHNMMMIGPPGSGKSMIAKRIRTILPGMNIDEAIDVSKIYSVAGLIDENIGIINSRPYRSPHHTITKQSLIGGGSDAKPGEIVLSHNGVLFLDEIAEFDKRNLETLRQPIEDKYVEISRVKYSTRYPCNTLVIAAMNPCPCGYYMSDRECRCKSYEVDRYINKLSGPLLDRFDIFLEVNPISYDEMSSFNHSESSKEIKYRVENARRIQNKRFDKSLISCNDEMKTSDIDKYCILDLEGKNISKNLFQKYNLSNRSYTKLLKVARTICDLKDKETISKNEIMEAFSFRKAYYTYFD